jgi:hypothetical protein
MLTAAAATFARRRSTACAGLDVTVEMLAVVALVPRGGSRPTQGDPPLTSLLTDIPASAQSRATR